MTSVIETIPNPLGRALRQSCTLPLDASQPFGSARHRALPRRPLHRHALSVPVSHDATDQTRGDPPRLERQAREVAEHEAPHSDLSARPTVAVRCRRPAPWPPERLPRSRSGRRERFAASGTAQLACARYSRSVRGDLRSFTGGLIVRGRGVSTAEHDGNHRARVKSPGPPGLAELSTLTRGGEDPRVPYAPVRDAPERFERPVPAASRCDRSRAAE